jgi:hypothetical protein
MIVDRDVLNTMGMDFMFSDGTMKWDNATVPM